MPEVRSPAIPVAPKIIRLPRDLYLASGRTRECFIDPRDPSRCIKLDFSDSGYRQTEKEALYYAKLARLKPTLTYDFIPRFHGFVETDRGRGGVFDLIRDDDGRVSRTLGKYLRDGTILKERPLWESALEVFLDRLMRTGVIVRDLNPGNLAARRRGDGTVRLVAIDGIGHRDFIPVCDYIPFFARRKIRRQIARKSMGSIQDLINRLEGRLPQ